MCSPRAVEAVTISRAAVARAMPVTPVLSGGSHLFLRGPLLINDDEGAERHLAELSEGVGRHAYAAVADGVAEHRGVRPSVQHDGAGSPAVGVEGVAVRSQREDQWGIALAGVDDRAQEEGASGRGVGVSRPHGNASGPDDLSVAEQLELAGSHVNPDDVRRLPPTCAVFSQPVDSFGRDGSSTSDQAPCRSTTGSRVSPICWGVIFAKGRRPGAA